MRSFKPLLFLIALFITTNIGSAQIVAPDFTVYTTHQDSFELYEDYLDKNKVVMIEFFFTTCPPCAEISPYMENLYQNWGGGNEDVEFILITNKSFDDNADVAAYANQYGFTFPGTGVDGGAIGVWNTYKNSPWGSIFGTPAFIIIAPDGTVQYDVSGSNVQSTLDSLNAALEIAVSSIAPLPAKHFDKIICTHAANADTIKNVKAVFTDYPNMGDTSIGMPINNGAYTEFLPDSLPSTASMTIHMEKEDAQNILKGVSTFDILLIQLSILGLKEFDRFEKAAADVNDDGRLSGLDIISLRKLLLGIDNEFPGGRMPWKFFPDYIPQRPLDSLQYDHIWHFPEEWRYAEEQENNGNMSFKGVKIGDVNFSWKPLKEHSDPVGTRSSNPYYLIMQPEEEAGLYSFYPMESDQKTYSFQFDLHSSEKADWKISTSLPSETFFVRNVNDNIIRIGFYDVYGKSLPLDRPVFQIYHNGPYSGELSIVQSEWYTDFENAREVRLIEKELQKVTAYPNPASTSITLKSNVEESIIISSLEGIQFKTHRISKGDNILDINTLPGGLYLISNKDGQLLTTFFKL